MRIVRLHDSKMETTAAGKRPNKVQELLKRFQEDEKKKEEGTKTTVVLASIRKPDKRDSRQQQQFLSCVDFDPATSQEYPRNSSYNARQGRTQVILSRQQPLSRRPPPHSGRSQHTGHTTGGEGATEEHTPVPAPRCRGGRKIVWNVKDSAVPCDVKIEQQMFWDPPTKSGKIPASIFYRSPSPSKGDSVLSAMNSKNVALDNGCNAVMSLDKIDSTKAASSPNKPLPFGPPPPKPPRTFEHDVYMAHKLSRVDEGLHDDAAKVTQHKFNTVMSKIGKGCVSEKAALFEQLDHNVEEVPKLRKGKEHASLLVSAKRNTKEGATRRLPSPPKDIPSQQILKEVSRRPMVAPYAVSDIANLVCSPNFDTDNTQTPMPKTRSQFFVGLDELGSTKTLKRCFSDEHIYEEPHDRRSRNGLTNDKAILTRTFSAEDEVFTNKVEYDRISCCSNGDFEKGTEGRRPTKLNMQALHYLSSPIVSRPDRFTNVYGSKKLSKHFKPIHRRKLSRDDAHGTLTRVVSETVRELIKRSFSQSSSLQIKPDSSRVLPDDDSGDSDSELPAVDLQERVEHGRTVRATSIKYSRVYQAKWLFDYVLVVGLQCEENTGELRPYIRLSYPPMNQTDFKQWVPHVSFPGAEFWSPSQTGETYTSVFTDENGQRTFGYCRRIQPDGCSVSLPVVYCIISPVMDFGFFSQILEELEKMYGCPDMEMTSFLKGLRENKLPSPGSELTIQNQVTNCTETIRRSEDPLVDIYGLEMLLSSLGSNNLIRVFASLLLERRILLLSDSLSQLSQCVQGLFSLLYPFCWDHTIIPVLPGCAIEVLCSPAPFLIGALHNDIPKLQESSIEEVLRVDLTNNTISNEHGDELKVIPKRLQKALSVALKAAKSVSESSRNVMISEAFLRVFVETVGCYNTFIVTQQDGIKIFQKEPFCTSSPSRSINSFRLWFTESQMFNTFIDSQICSSICPALFEKRIKEYETEMENSHVTFKENFKEFGKRMKNIGEKLIGFRSPAKLESKMADKG